MTRPVRCRHCHQALVRCDCGAADGRAHWVDDGQSSGSRWCPLRSDRVVQDRLHEPEVAP